MTAFAGVRGTGDWGTDERPKNFREGILWLRPQGASPIFALTSKIGKKTVNDPEFAWWNEPENITRLQVKGAVGKPAAGATKSITVDSTDPTAANLAKNRGSALNLRKGDILIVESTDNSDVANWNPQYLVVAEDPTSATQFKAWFGQNGSASADLPDNTYLFKMGNVFAEGTRAPTSASRNPYKFYNYTQIFKTVYEVTGTAKETRARTGDALKVDKKRKMFDHAQAIEWSILFGKRSEIMNGRDSGKPQRTMGGLLEFIPRTVMSGGWDLDDLGDAISEVFDWESPAGDSRIAFCGNGALNAFNKKIRSQDKSYNTINYDSKDKMYGINFRSFTVPQGTIHLKTHPLMSRHPIYTNSLILVDGSCLKWVAMKNRDTKSKDNIQHNDEDTIKGMWMTEGSLMVDKGGLTMKYIGGIK